MTTGVAPDLIVSGVVAWTETRLPAAASLRKNATPAEMSLAVPPSARLAIITPASAEGACVGLPSSAIEPANL
jgi:hypothetical protein